MPVSAQLSVQPGVLSMHLGVLNPLPGWWLVPRWALSLRPRAWDTEGLEPPHSRVSVCLSGLCCRLSDPPLLFCLSACFFFSVVPEPSLPRPHPSCCNPEDATVGRPGQSWLWCIPRHTHALTGRWLRGHVVPLQGSLCLFQSLCLHLCFSLSLSPRGDTE